MSVVFKVETRTGNGPKSHVRTLRKEGRVPGVVYGGSTPSEAISLELAALMKEMRKPGFFNHIFELDLGGKTHQVLPRDVHFHPVTDAPLHVDFMRVSKDSRVTVSVPLQFINADKSPGLKRGGMLNVVVHAIEMSVPANAIPEKITIDLDGMQVGEAVHMDRLNFSADWRVIHAERDNTLATIAAPSGLTEAEAAGESK
jgi:large subunit ribosomal protein L25